MSRVRGYSNCIECNGKVTVDPVAYTPRLILLNGYFFESSVIEREKACSVCGLVHNFELHAMNPKKTFVDIIENLRNDASFQRLSYREKALLLRKVRKYWNTHYKKLDRRQDAERLLDFILQNLD